MTGEPQTTPAAPRARRDAPSWAGAEDPVAGLVGLFIKWASHRAPYAQGVVTFDNIFLFNRYEFVRRDEWPDATWEANGGPEGRFKTRPNRLPWWLPLNAFLHSWNPEPGSQEGFHDHPRWSITICLAGSIIERTPWGDRMLKPGSIVVRSRRAIHAFKVPEDHSGPIWTLFIVGRRVARQNTYVITAR